MEDNLNGLPKVVPDANIEQVDKYRWAYVVMFLVGLLMVFVTIYYWSNKGRNDDCQAQLAAANKRISHLEDRQEILINEILTKQGVIDRVTKDFKTKIDTADVIRTVKNQKTTTTTSPTK